MTRRLTFTALGAIAAILTLSGCEKTKEQFDFSKKPPDEFAVVKREPLEMPPDFSLRPPTPGAARPQEQATDAQARAAVLGDTSLAQKPRVDAASDGESVLLQQAGAGYADPNIRSKVDKETAELAEEDMPGIDQLKKMIGKDVEAPAMVVDPTAEAERIKTNKDTGKPISEGETPKIEE